MKVANALAAVAMLCCTAAAAQERASSPSKITVATAGFLKPWNLRLTVPDTDPQRQRACRGIPSVQCAPMLIFGGSGNGGIPTVDPVLTGDAPHVRVTFVLQQVRIVELGENSTEGYEFRMIWDTHSDAAGQESSHTEFSFAGSHHVDSEGYLDTPLAIYDALLLNACSSFTSFPVTHHATIEDMGDALPVPFDGTDKSTIDGPGFYRFDYLIHVVSAYHPDDDGVNLRLSGAVNVTCTGSASL